MTYTPMLYSPRATIIVLLFSMVLNVLLAGFAVFILEKIFTFCCSNPTADFRFHLIVPWALFLYVCVTVETHSVQMFNVNEIRKLHRYRKFEDEREDQAQVAEYEQVSMSGSTYVVLK